MEKVKILKAFFKKKKKKKKNFLTKKIMANSPQ
jgi:hypothetical protein